MRIAFVSHWSGRGGAEKALIEIIKAAIDVGHRPACFIPVDGGLRNELEGIGVPVTIVPYPWWASDNTNPLMRLKHVACLPFSAARLSQALRGFQLVYSNSAVCPAGALAAKLAGIPHVWHLHEVIGAKGGQRFYFGLNLSRWVIGKLSSLVIGASQSVLESSNQRGAVLYVPTRVRKVEKFATNAIVMVGHLSKLKRHRDAIEAIRLLRERGVAVRLRIVGDGEERASLQSLAQGLPVEFVGKVQDASQEIANALALVNCSPVEGFGRVTAEALLLRTPVIAADGGANRELIRHEVTGLLFRAGDANSLAEAILRVVSTPLDEMTERGYQFINSICSPDTFPERLGKLIRDSTGE